MTEQEISLNASAIVARLTGYIEAKLKLKSHNMIDVAKYLAELHRKFPIAPNWSSDAANSLEHLIQKHKNESDSN